MERNPINGELEVIGFAPQAAPRRSRVRVSSDSVWPLRSFDGRPFYERLPKPNRPEKTT
jgi:hypothetical protein